MRQGSSPQGGAFLPSRPFSGSYHLQECMQTLSISPGNWGGIYGGNERDLYGLCAEEEIPQLQKHLITC